MAQRYFQKLVPGETLLIGARFVGEDIGGASLRLDASGGLPVDGFVLSKPSDDTAQILNDLTSAWPVGFYILRLWFDWDSGDVGSEVALEVRLSVEASI